MKTRKTFVLFIAFALMLSLSAFADVAYTPRDDFYEAHYRDCQGLERYHFTNGTEGYVVGYSSPTGEAKVVIPNGKEYFVSVIWDGEGKTWGCIEYEPNTLEIAYAFQGGESAWVDMSSMTPRYDNQAFMEEHESELQHGVYSLFIAEGCEVITYRYPGSGIVCEHISYYDGWENALSLDYRYTDSEGREWGRVGYYYGTRDVWVCIDDPYAELPAGAEYRKPELIPAASESEMEAALGEANGLSTQLVVGAVGIVVIAAAMLAYIIIRKRHRERS